MTERTQATGWGSSSLGPPEKRHGLSKIAIAGSDDPHSDRCINLRWSSPQSSVLGSTSTSLSCAVPAPTRRLGYRALNCTTAGAQGLPLSARCNADQRHCDGHAGNLLRLTLRDPGGCKQWRRPGELSRPKRRRLRPLARRGALHRTKHVQPARERSGVAGRQLHCPLGRPTYGVPTRVVPATAAPRDIGSPPHTWERVSCVTG